MSQRVSQRVVHYLQEGNSGDSAADNIDNCGTCICTVWALRQPKVIKVSTAITTMATAQLTAETNPRNTAAHFQISNLESRKVSFDLIS